MKGDVSFKDFMTEYLSNEKNLQSFIETAIEESRNEGTEDYLVVAIRYLIEQKGVKNIAEEAEMSRATLYKAFWRNGNPTLKNLNKVLNALNLELTLRPKPKCKEKAFA